MFAFCHFYPNLETVYGVQLDQVGTYTMQIDTATHLSRRLVLEKWHVLQVDVDVVEALVERIAGPPEMKQKGTRPRESVGQKNRGWAKTI